MGRPHELLGIRERLRGQPVVVASATRSRGHGQDRWGFLRERLYGWGVRRVFGYPGDGINALLGGLQRFGTDKIQFVQARHEEMAAFMASAYAKFTGELGVCVATSGPGASHLITGMYDARMDHMPLLAIAGQQARAAVGGHYQQEVDLVSMFKDVAGAYVQQASTAPQVRHLIDRAVRIAKAERRVTALVVPNDLGDEPYEDPPRKHGTIHSGIGYTDPRVVPFDVDLRRAAEVLNSGKRVAILVGAGALHATDEVIAVADKLGAGAAKALLGKAALPDDLPWVTGSIGLLGTKPSWEMMTECDTLLMIGSGFPYSEFLPKEGAARGVQIDLKPDMLSLRYPMEVNLTGDSVQTLRALLPLLEEKAERSWRREIEKNVADWWKLLETRAMQTAKPVNPQRVAWELSPRLPERAIITSDSGILRKLVCPRYPDPARNDVFTVRRSGVDGSRGALRDRSQICSSRPPGCRSGGRRCHADEQHGGTDHSREVLARMVEPDLGRLRLQQSGSEPGHVGAARSGR